MFTFSNFYFLIVIVISCSPYKPPPFLYLLSILPFFYKNFVLAAAPDMYSHYFFILYPLYFCTFPNLFFTYYPLLIYLPPIIYTTPLFLVSIITFIIILFLKLLIPLYTGASIINFYTSNIFFWIPRLLLPHFLDTPIAYHLCNLYFFFFFLLPVLAAAPDNFLYFLPTIFQIFPFLSFSFYHLVIYILLYCCLISIF